MKLAVLSLYELAIDAPTSIAPKATVVPFHLSSIENLYHLKFLFGLLRVLLNSLVQRVLNYNYNYIETIERHQNYWNSHVDNFFVNCGIYEQTQSQTKEKTVSYEKPFI